MTIEIWLAYVLTTTIILVVPGPTIILVMSQAVTHGRRSVIPLVTGVVLGDLTSMTMSILGLGAIMATSSFLFQIFKWMGVVYLVYLGIKTWRADPGSDSAHDEKKLTSNGSLFKSSYVVTSLNPKGIAFFVAFLPQFISPESSVTGQILIFCSTFLVLAFVNALFYAVFASRVRDIILRTSVKRWFNRLGGTALIGAGIVTAGLEN